MANHVDQALGGLKKCGSYIESGTVTAKDLATDFLGLADLNKDEIDEYKALMKDFVEMEHDVKSFVSSVEKVSEMVSTEFGGNLEKRTNYLVFTVLISNVSLTDYAVMHYFMCNELLDF